MGANLAVNLPHNPQAERAQECFQQGNYAEARIAIESALEQRFHVELQAMLALCLLQLEEFDEAERAARTALQKEPKSSLCHYAWGEYLYTRGRYAPALKHAKQAAELSIDRPQHHVLVAACSLALFRPKVAAVAVRRALRMDPDNLAAHQLKLRLLSGPNEEHQVSDAIEAAKRAGSDSSKIHSSIGWNALHRGDSTNARTSFQHALALDPNDEWAAAGLKLALKSDPFLSAMLIGLFHAACRVSPRSRFASFHAWAFLGTFSYRYLIDFFPRIEKALKVFGVVYLIALVFFVLAPTWLNLAICLKRFGGQCLTKAERYSAYSTAAAVGLMLAIVATLFTTGNNTLLTSAFAFGVLALPISTLSFAPAGIRTTIRIGTAVCLATAVTAGTLVLLCSTNAELIEQAQRATAISGLGTVLFLWIDTLLPYSRAK